VARRRWKPGEPLDLIHLPPGLLGGRSFIPALTRKEPTDPLRLVNRGLSTTRPERATEVPYRQLVNETEEGGMKLAEIHQRVVEFGQSMLRGTLQLGPAA